MIVRMSGAGRKAPQKKTQEPSAPSSYGSPQIASIYAPPPGNRAQSLAAAYTHRADQNQLSRPMSGPIIGRGLSSLSDKLARLDIKKISSEPAVRF